MSGIAVKMPEPTGTYEHRVARSEYESDEAAKLYRRSVVRQAVDRCRQTGRSPVSAPVVHETARSCLVTFGTVATFQLTADQLRASSAYRDLWLLAEAA